MDKSVHFVYNGSSVINAISGVKKRLFKALAFATVAVFTTSSAFAVLSGGTYNINASTSGGGPITFNSFNDFFSYLSTTHGNQISGNVILNVDSASGPYNERVRIPQIFGAGMIGANRQGIVINGNGALLQFTVPYSYSSRDGAVLFLDSAEYVTVNDLHIKCNGTNSYTAAVVIGAGADSAIFDNCIMEAQYTSYASNQCALAIQRHAGYRVSYGGTFYYPYQNPDAAEGAKIMNCELIGGYYNLRDWGNNTGYKGGHTFMNNTFMNAMYYNTYFYYTADVTFHDNYISNPGNTYYDYGYSIYAYYSNRMDFQRNIVDQGKAYGNYLGRLNTNYHTGGRSIFANNMIRGNFKYYSSTWSTGYGVYSYYSDELDIVFNSIYMAEGTNGNAMSIGCYGLGVYRGDDVTVQNNAVRVEPSSSASNQYSLYWYLPTNSSMNNNSYFSEGNGENFYYNGSQYTSWSAYETASSDTTSQWSDPFFVSPNDVHTNGANLYQRGVSFTGITTDIDGTSRPAMPSIGAHEFTPPLNDAGVTVFTAPVAQCPDTNAVEIEVRNMGVNQLDSVEVFYEISRGGSSIASDDFWFVPTTPMSTGDVANVFLQQLPMVSGAPDYDFKAWTRNPNNVTDEDFSNDTATFSTQTAMVGAFTIGGTSPDFPTFTSAVQALETYGMCGAVTMYARDGATYTESLQLPMILGSSMDNWLTFTTDTNNTGTVVLSFSGSGYTEGVIDLEGATYVTVDGYDLQANGASYKTGVSMENGTHDVVISNCSWSTTSTSSLARGVYVNGTGYDNLTFDGNSFTGGYYGMYVYGNSSDLNTGITLTNNTFTDQYYYGAYLYYGSDYIIDDNNFDLHGSGSYQYSRAIYSYNYPGGSVTSVSRNNVRANYYGAYLYYMDGNNSEHGMITNNKFLVGDTSGNAGNFAYAFYGMLIYGGFNDIVHNTFVSGNHYNTSGYGVYINGGLNTSKNNIFNRIGGGYNTYTPGGFALIESDYNAYASLDYGTTSPSSDLAYMQNQGYDDNSIEIVDPIFANLDSLYTCYDSLVGAGIYVEDVPTDINMAMRNVNGPTIGAEEYISPGAFSLGDNMEICDGDTLYLGQEVAGATYQWSPNNETDPMIMVTQAGTYGVEITTGCGVGEDEIDVEDASSVASFTYAPSWLTAIFSNSSVKADTYYWEFKDLSGTVLGTSTDMNPSFLFPATGDYEACLTATGSCDTDESCQTVSVSDYVGIAELNAGEVTMFPNPASDNLTIQAAHVAGSVLSIEISNISGQVVMTNRLNEFNGQEILDISQLTKGVYFVKIFTSEQATTKRLVVQK